MSLEVGEDMHLEVHDIGKDFVAVQDLEGTKEVGVRHVSVGKRQDAVVGL